MDDVVARFATVPAARGAIARLGRAGIEATHVRVASDSERAATPGRWADRRADRGLLVHVAGWTLVGWLCGAVIGTAVGGAVGWLLGGVLGLVLGALMAGGIVAGSGFWIAGVASLDISEAWEETWAMDDRYGAVVTVHPADERERARAVQALRRSQPVGRVG